MGHSHALDRGPAATAQALTLRRGLRLLALTRVKVFFTLYFLPSWIASLLMWGDDRTSSGFQAAPPLFFRAQLAIQLVAVLILFFPLRLRHRPSVLSFFLAAVVCVTLYFVKPAIEAEFVLISGSILIAIIAAFLSFAQPNAVLRSADLGWLFYLFAGGFALQILLYFQFGILPSHSSSELFIRFNGITNDSLSSSFIIAVFIPWAVTGKRAIAKTLVIIAEAFVSGSMFGVVFVPLAVIAFLVYRRAYRYLAIIAAITGGGIIVMFEQISAILSLKVDSVLIHMRFFLNILGLNLRQSTSKCSEEFCESFIESGLSLSPVYLVAFFALMLCFVVPLFRPMGNTVQPRLVRDSLCIYGAALVIGSLVHPVPLIPFAIPMFLILASLYSGERAGLASRRAGSGITGSASA